MARFITKSRSEIGDSPYELKFRGKQKAENILMRVIDFDADHLEEYQLNEFRDIQKHLDTDTVTWLNVDGLHDADLIQQIGEVFELDRIIMSDVLDTDKRPKVQEYEECIYVSVKMLRYDESENELYTENLSLIIAENLLISFQERKGDVFEPVRERIRKQKRKIRASGTDYLAFALLDIVIDNYIYILSVLGEKIENLEDRMIQNQSKKVIEKINEYKREINYLRKNIQPAREMIYSLSKLDSELIDKDSTEVHWKELQDNIVQAIETSDSYREILSDMLNIYHTTLSTRLNDTMKFLTIFSVIFIPLTFIAGIYGTNFDNVPELHYRYSYFIMWAVMVAIAIGMVIYFKRKKWF
ncbi:MAG: magnesium/cobalt transporter CorA [Flavobacteriales bacterium]